MNFSINIIDNINNNSGTVTVTKNTPYVLTTTTKHGGFKGEQKNYNIKGSTSSKGRITIATIKVEAASGKEFTKSPSLSSKNNIKLVLSSIEQKTTSSGRRYINSYLFNVVYYNTVSVSVQDDIKANLIYKDSARPTITTSTYVTERKITKLTFGKPTLSKGGETREITLIGAPNSTATITIKDDNKNSILIDKYPYEGNIGEIVDSNSCTIGSNGKYSFNQKFPSIISRGTAVNGSMAASGTDKIIFDDLTGVKVGDRVVLTSSRDETVFTEVTVLNPDGNNTNECTVSPNLTAADNALVLFKRSRTYEINIEASSGLGSNIPTTTPTYTLYQYRDPVLTIRTEGNAAYTITQFNGVATGYSAGTAHEKKYAGIANLKSKQTGRYSRVKETISFSYLLTASGGERFTSFTTPIFNKSLTPGYASNKGVTSHWTNSVPSKNGGTDISIVGISITDLNETTLTISGTITINNWGYKDVTMALDFNELLTYTS